MNYAQIRHYDISNGEGIRTSLFLSGCKFNCDDCFNMEYQDFKCGNLITEEIIFNIVKNIQEEEISGLSILGGDPLWQDVNGLSQLIEICKTTHIYNKTVWLWSGFTWEMIFPEVILNNIVPERIFRQELIRNVDIFVDGQFDKSKKDLCLKWRGSSNQRIIDVQKSIQKKEVILYHS